MNQAKIKQGTVRDDSKIFWGTMHGKESWITKEQYDKRIASRIAYRKMCQEQYKKRQAAKNSMDRNYIGKYDFSKNLYFIRVSTSGKEMWGTKEELERYRQRRNKASYSRFLRLQNYSGQQLKIGDVNPSNPNQFVIYMIGKKPYFGSQKELQENIQRRTISYRKRNQKYYKIRKDIMSKIMNKIKRGTVNSENGLIFWIYNVVGKEKWITKEEYDHKMEQERQRKIKYSNKRKKA